MLLSGEAVAPSLSHGKEERGMAGGLPSSPHWLTPTGVPTITPAYDEAKAALKPMTNYQQGERCSAEPRQSLRLQNPAGFGSEAVEQQNSFQLLKGIIITVLSPV